MAQNIVPYMDLECVLRLFVACVCGASIGFERTRRHKGAGIRTHMIVALGAALFVIVSRYGFIDVVGKEGVQVDVARVASNVVTGVSFLGAGLIKRGDYIQGLTTAAGIWMVAAIGLAIGSGQYILGISGTILIILVQWIFHAGGKLSVDKLVVSSIVVTMEDDPKAFRQFLDKMKSLGIEVSGNHINRHRDMSITYTLDVRMPKTLEVEEILMIVKECDFVKAIEM